MVVVVVMIWLPLLFVLRVAIIALFSRFRVIAAAKFGHYNIFPVFFSYEAGVLKTRESVSLQVVQLTWEEKGRINQGYLKLRTY